jgi:N-acetylmuramoyl-L-alanine amidase
VKTTEEAFVKSYNSEQAKNQQDIAALSADPISPPAPMKKVVLANKAGKKIIVLDPGHGGIDPGAVSPTGTREKDVVLSFASALRQALVATGKYDVVMTRSDDRFVSLKNRVSVAREKEADLFLAIHADTVRGRDARGATIYTLSDKASDAEAEALAKRENRADIIGGLDLEAETEEITDILIDLAQRESKNHAMFFSKKAVAQLKPLTRMTGKPLRSAGFMVLKAPDVPSVLLELGFLSSKSDEKLLTSAAWQAKIAKAFATAMDSYFATEVASRAN